MHVKLLRQPFNLLKVQPNAELRYVISDKKLLIIADCKH